MLETASMDPVMMFMWTLLKVRYKIMNKMVRAVTLTFLTSMVVSTLRKLLLPTHITIEINSGSATRKSRHRTTWLVETLACESSIEIELAILIRLLKMGVLILQNLKRGRSH